MAAHLSKQETDGVTRFGIFFDSERERDAWLLGHGGAFAVKRLDDKPGAAIRGRPSFKEEIAAANALLGDRKFPTKSARARVIRQIISQKQPDDVPHIRTVTGWLDTPAS